MGYKKLFLDSDVILDLILWREPFALQSRTILNSKFKRNVELFTSPLIIANMNYLLTKEVGKEASRNHIKNIISFISILNFDGDIIEKAVNSLFSDFEDSIQFFIAERYNCDAIITRNTKDYKHSTIPVITPEQFLKTL